MLPPVGATSILSDYPSSAPPQAAARPLVNANDDVNDAAVMEAPLSGARQEALSLSGQLHLARAASVFAETIGQLLKMPRGESESLAAYAARITEAVKALSAAEKLGLQRLLNQVVNGLTLRLLAEILKNPSGPGAARLALQMEITQTSDRDLAKEAAVTSYRQTDAVPVEQTARRTAAIPQPIPFSQEAGDIPFQPDGSKAAPQPSPGSNARGAQAELPQRPQEIEARSLLNGAPRGPAERAAPQSRQVGTFEAGSSPATPAANNMGPPDLPADAATKPDVPTGAQTKTALRATPQDADPPLTPPPHAQKERGFYPASPIADQEPHEAGAGRLATPSLTRETQVVEPQPDADGGAATATERPLWGTQDGRSASEGKGTALGQTGALPEQAAAAAFREGDDEPLPALNPPSNTGKLVAPEPASHGSILGITEQLVKAYASRALAEALIPLIDLLPAAGEGEAGPGEAEAAPRSAQPMDVSGGSRLARPMSPETEDGAAPPRKAEGSPGNAATPSQRSDPAEMRDPSQLALPLILPREGWPLPYVTYPPTAPPTRQQEPKVRSVSEIGEDDQEQQQPSRQHDFDEGRQDEKDQQAPPDAAEPEDNHAGEAGRANDLYWRMAGWS